MQNYNKVWNLLHYLWKRTGGLVGLVSAYFAEAEICYLFPLYRFPRHALFHISKIDLWDIICQSTAKFCMLEKKEWAKLQWTLRAQSCKIHFVFIPITLNRDENALRTLSFNLAFNLITFLHTHTYTHTPPLSLCWKLSGITPSLTCTGKSSIIWIFFYITQGVEGLEGGGPDNVLISRLAQFHQFSLALIRFEGFAFPKS